MDAADGTADGVIDLDHAAAPPVCFVAGTLIATPSGAVPVESLRPGDLVATWDDGAQPVRWVTHTTRSLADLVTNPKWRPVRIPAGALGHKQPATDLYVSRQHRMLITGKKAMRRYGCAQKLLPAKDLIGWRGIELLPAQSGDLSPHRARPLCDADRQRHARRKLLARARGAEDTDPGPADRADRSLPGALHSGRTGTGPGLTPASGFALCNEEASGRWFGNRQIRRQLRLRAPKGTIGLLGGRTSR
jgi:hypothetical protein